MRCYLVLERFVQVSDAVSRRTGVIMMALQQERHARQQAEELLSRTAHDADSIQTSLQAEARSLTLLCFSPDVGHTLLSYVSKCTLRSRFFCSSWLLFVSIVFRGCAGTRVDGWSESNTV